MEIKRKFEMLAATKRSFVIRQSPPCEQILCTECGEVMLTAEQTSRLLGIEQRRIFRIIEKAEAHFTETETGAVMICLTSLAAVLDEQKAECIMLETGEEANTDEN